jgi:hypothetical protein
MKTAELIRDSVFQLNLLIWMAKEQPPTGYVVRPLFFENGFAVLYIEQPFPFPEETLAAIRNSPGKISEKPEPELLLGRMSDKKALYFEAKANSFSPASDTARQARAHLLAAGEAFAEVMAPLQFCLLCYVVPDDKRLLMAECLQELAADLAGAALKPGPHSSHGLAVDQADLRYTWDEAFQQYVGIAGTSAVVMAGLTEDTDPSPLFLIYTDEDYPDPEKQNLLRRCLVNQVHAHLVCDLNALPPGDTHEFTAESLLNSLTQNLFQFLGRDRQKSMRRMVTEAVLRRIAQFCKDKYSGGITLQQGVLNVRFPDQEAKDSFLEWLEDFNRTAFQPEKHAAEPPGLFDGIQDGENE